MPIFPDELEPVGETFVDNFNRIPATFRELDGLGVFRREVPGRSRPILEVKLQAALYRGVTDGKVVGRLVSWDGSVFAEMSPAVERDIYADHLDGYLFSGDIIRAEVCSRNGRTYAIDPGVQFVQGTAAATIASGATGTINLSGGRTISAKAVLGGVSSGQKVGCAWDRLQSLWLIIAAEC